VFTELKNVFCLAVNVNGSPYKVMSYILTCITFCRVECIQHVETRHSGTYYSSSELHRRETVISTTQAWHLNCYKEVPVKSEWLDSSFGLSCVNWSVIHAFHHKSILPVDFLWHVYICHKKVNTPEGYFTATF